MGQAAHCLFLKKQKPLADDDFPAAAQKNHPYSNQPKTPLNQGSFRAILKMLQKNNSHSLLFHYLIICHQIVILRLENA